MKTLYKNDFSSSAFKHDEANWLEWQIQGKFCLISLEGDILDIWLTKPGPKPLSNRKLNSMIARMSPLPWTILDGEAYAKTPDLDFIRKHAPVLGIKAKKVYSEAAMERAQARGRELARG
jgi:hypothetical protein